MQNPSDTAYFVYLYVFTCEQCHCPHVIAHLLANTPKDAETDQAPADWTCENCNSLESTAAYRGAVYAKKLSVKNGKCSERGNGGTLIQS